MGILWTPAKTVQVDAVGVGERDSPSAPEKLRSGLVFMNDHTLAAANAGSR